MQKGGSLLMQWLPTLRDKRTLPHTPIMTVFLQTKCGIKKEEKKKGKQKQDYQPHNFTEWLVWYNCTSELTQNLLTWGAVFNQALWELCWTHACVLVTVNQVVIFWKNSAPLYFAENIWNRSAGGNLTNMIQWTTETITKKKKKDQTKT